MKSAGVKLDVVLEIDVPDEVIVQQRLRSEPLELGLRVRGTPKAAAMAARSCSPAPRTSFNQGRGAGCRLWLPIGWTIR